MTSVGVQGTGQGSVSQKSNSGSSVPRGADCWVVFWIVEDLGLG